VQQTIFFSAGLVQGSSEQDTAKQLIRFFQSPEVADVIRQTGVEPVVAK
jgi:molybdate transport system substrate-binding protein